MKRMRKNFTAALFFVALAALPGLPAAAQRRGGKSGPALGPPTTLQTILNALPAIPIAGNNLQFQFGGDVWIANNNGLPFMAGIVAVHETDESSFLLLKQTHLQAPYVGWIVMSGPEIIFEYRRGPPASLKTISREDLSEPVAEALYAGMPEQPEGQPRRPRTRTATASEPKAPKEKRVIDPADTKLWTVGASVGSSFSSPWFIGTVHGTLAPLTFCFFEIGLDAGFVSGGAAVDYYSLYPFIHAAGFIPFKAKGGWYIGAGAGYMFATYTFHSPADTVPYNSVALDVITGVNILDIIDVSYTLRTNFSGVNHKVSVGYTYRFR